MKNKKLILGILLLIVAIVAIIFGINYVNKDKKDDVKTENSSSSEQIESSSEAEAPVDFSKLTLPQLSNEVTENEAVVEIVTTMGTIKAKLFPEFAPKAVENFITHSKDGYYDGTIFHRVIEDFMIQGGDPDGTGMGGESIWGKPFGVEISPELYHIRGALAMAKTNQPISIGSQFYVVQNSADMSAGLSSSTTPEKIIEAYKNGGYPSLDGGYTVFGQVIEGMDVVDKIAAVEVGQSDKPKEDIKIEKINVIQEAK
ncbi:Cyclophilin type peptidyl-prolyl cis-trans isomerase/CLD family protein [Carnobacterium maltaromaticum]|uniref:peptidylprolyl isomerase n=1 Tax=Carnobacterium maltaromaticum TaxID=2751 RepID=UPI000704ABFF|nr:peptidylprolyl isomerase [Carnobacterium maltaromaticum]KRN72468.1 peptidyl-prolyl cis-trans isomerase [Carnobacterium maltaromaticum]CRH17987.1 Cyclophilin type peptidyl-prolyl cis-trans isomerase/CLD family protein [Carnobacterium maltaromaticum]